MWLKEQDQDRLFKIKRKDTIISRCQLSDDEEMSMTLTIELLWKHNLLSWRNFCNEWPWATLWKYQVLVEKFNSFSRHHESASSSWCHWWSWMMLTTFSRIPLAVKDNILQTVATTRCLKKCSTTMSHLWWTAATQNQAWLKASTPKGGQWNHWATKTRDHSKVLVSHQVFSCSRQVRLSLGSDTGKFIRQLMFFMGLKPTYGTATFRSHCSLVVIRTIGPVLPLRKMPLSMLLLVKMLKTLLLPVRIADVKRPRHQGYEIAWPTLWRN